VVDQLEHAPLGVVHFRPEPVVGPAQPDPVVAAVSILAILMARRVSVIQRGSIQAYLAYIFVILLALLVVLR
jgi:hypothetical protein